MAKHKYHSNSDQHDPKIFQESLGSFGTTTAPGENQLSALATKVKQGVRHVELHLANVGKGEFYKHDVPDKYGFEQRRTIMQLAKMNEQTLSVHSTFNVNSFSGLGQRGGFDEQQRSNNIREIDESIKFASETAKGGAVVFHLHETQLPTPASELNLSKQYLKDLKNGVYGDSGKKNYEKLQKEFKCDFFERQFQENPNLKNEIRVKFENLPKSRKDYLKDSFGILDWKDFYEHNHAEKLKLEQEGNPLVVVGESITKAQRGQSILDLKEENFKNLTQKEKDFLEGKGISTNYKNKLEDSEFNINDFQRLQELFSKRKILESVETISNEEFNTLKKKLSKEYYDVYKENARMTSVADKEYFQKTINMDIRRSELQLIDIQNNRARFSDYIEIIDNLKKKEIVLSRKLENVNNEVKKTGETKDLLERKKELLGQLNGSPEQYKKDIDGTIKELYSNLSGEEFRRLQNLQLEADKIKQKAQNGVNITKEEERKFFSNQEEISKLSKNPNLSESKQNYLEKKIEDQQYFRKSGGGIKGELDLLNYQIIGQAEFQKLEKYDEIGAQLQEQIKKLEEQKENSKALTEQIYEKNTLAMADLGLNAMKYQLDLYTRSKTSLSEKKKVEGEILDIQKKISNESDNFKRNKLNCELMKKKYELRNYTGVSDYADIVSVDETGKKFIKTPLYLAPENIMAGYGYMDSLEEYKSVIRGSWKDFAEKILSTDPQYKRIKKMYEDALGEKITKENAFEIAKRHIGGTFDNAHAGVWLKYFRRDNGESESERLERFNKFFPSFINTHNVSIIRNPRVISKFILFFHKFTI